MKKILDRHLLNPELTFYSGTLDNVQISTRSEIDHCIDRWKSILVQQAKHGIGSRALLNFQIRNVNWLSVLFANWELGGQQTSLHPTFPELWSPWNVMVSDNTLLDLFKSHAKHCLSSNIDQYVGHDVTTVPSVCLPKHNATALNTSGTTGAPKPLEHSHEFLYDLSCRNGKILNFDQLNQEQALLVHGGPHNVLLLYVLPVLNCFKQVHSLPFDPNRMHELTQYVADHEISTVMLPHTLAVELFLEHAPKFEHDVNIFHLLSNQSNWIELVKEKNIQSIRNAYGASEVLGPVLSNTITQQSDSGYSPDNLGQLLDDFYQVRLTEQHELEVMHSSNGTYVIQDHFVLDHTKNLWYNNRNINLRLQGQDIPWGALDCCVQAHGNPSLMCILGDPELDYVYLLVDQSYSQDQIDNVVNLINNQLTETIPGLSIDYVDCVNIDKFINSHKINLSQVKHHFRTKFNLLSQTNLKEKIC